MVDDHAAVPQAGQAVVRGLVFERRLKLRAGSTAARARARPNAGGRAARRRRTACQEIVGAGVEAFDHVGRAVARGEEDDVDVRRRTLPHRPADGEAVGAGHHPVEDREARTVVGEEGVDGGGPVVHRRHGVPEPDERLAKHQCARPGRHPQSECAWACRSVPANRGRGRTWRSPVQRVTVTVRSSSP